MTDTHRACSVLIVGAGPAGMATALELRKWGVEVILIDALKTPRTTSRAGGVHARTFELLDRYDLTERLIAGRKGLKGFTVFVKGVQVAQMPSHLANSRYRMAPPIPQANIEKIFREELVEQGVPVHWEHELVGLEQDEEGATAKVQTPGGVLTVRADWIVGADGSYSKARELAGLTFEGESYPESYGLMDADLDWDLPPDCLRSFFNDGPQQIVIVPFGEFYRLQINARPIEMVNSPPTVEEMQEVFDRVTGLRGKISNPTWTSAYRLHRKQVSAYRSGRVFVAGDAAHIHSPAGAQGLNTGVQDGINLGWKLGLVIKGAANPSLLDTYEEERKPIATGVLKLSDNLSTRAADFVGGAELPPQVLADTTAQLLVNYRPGPLGRALEGPPGGPLPPGTPPGAGDRLPDIEIDGERVYNGLREAGVVVVLFGDDKATQKAADRFAAFQGVVEVWRHAGGDELAKALGIETGAAVIRPDAYLGLVAGGDVAAAAAAAGAWLEERLKLVPSSAHTEPSA